MASQPNNKPNIYEPCKGIMRVKPEYEIDEELIKQIAQEYRTLPSYEKTLFEQLYIKHYSLERNQLLKCRWQQYRDHIAEKVFSPFQFPSNRDQHFYNGSVKFLPSESIHRQASFRMRLKPGPGVDYRGQMPIPNESLMKRGIEGDKEKSQAKEKKTVKAKYVNPKALRPIKDFEK